MIRCLLFPGQGAQAVGMGRALYDSAPEAREVFERVDAALGQPLSRLIFDGPADSLTLTENAQPALMATSLAAVRALEAASGRPIAELASYAAGHSLGEYSALAATGAIAIEDAARLLRLRGQAMQAAVPVGEGAMAAILGLDIASVEAVAADASDAGIVVVGNDNVTGQAVLSGAAPAVERAVELARERGARRAMLLQVSAPFHCPLMEPAAQRLAEALAGTTFRRPSLPVIANVSARPEDDPAAFADLLVRQVTARVRWRESMAMMAELGVGGTIELGAGRVLSGLAKRGLAGAELVSLQTPDDIDAFVAGL